MKYTIAIAAILGMAQGFAVLDKFGNMQVIEERAPLSDTQLLQDDDYSEVPASMIGSPSASGYERPMPEEFSAERDDRLMNSLIGKYARTTQDLLLAEDMVKEISLYLWLSYRFDDYFLDYEKAKRYRATINKYIESLIIKKGSEFNYFKCDYLHPKKTINSNNPIKKFNHASLCDTYGDSRKTFIYNNYTINIYI